MRFFIVLISFVSSSISMAAVSDFNGLVKEATQQEKRLHRKLLHAIQGTQVSIAYNDRVEQIQAKDVLENNKMSVRLVQAEEK
ncbi:hypothetical protein [Bdellovibrio sp. HCB-162]|uniref:hypothetical protein n=1 Tax=Bdellovibrio sp. HCB-162 TaxID=3394234 RepID=UPI0039BCF222